MGRLTANHIDHITKDLNRRGIIDDEIQAELLDHVCSSVELEMMRGMNFMEAYHKVLHSFGHNTGLRQVQKSILQTRNKPPEVMIRNYIILAIRNLKKHRFYSFINIAGLATGIAACLIIALFVIHELSYDRYNVNASRIFRINSEIKFAGNHVMVASVGAPMAEILTQNYPEVESYNRFKDWGPRYVRRNGSTDRFREPDVIWSDKSFFSIFTVNVLSGSPATALQEPNSIAISQTMAEKYFPGEDALGKSLILDEDNDCKVTAVFEDIPVTSHFHFHFILSMAGLEEARSVNLLGGADLQTYLLLHQPGDREALEKKFPEFIDKYIGPQMAGVLGADFTMTKFRSTGNMFEYSLMPLTDIHLYSDLLGEFERNGSITYVFLFSTIGIFILVIACINFMNLSTARSSNRAKEVGIRKVLGSLRTHLVRQFLMEAFLLSVISFLLATGLAWIILPVFNDLAQIQISLPLNDLSFYGILLSASMVVGLLAGLYPSFFLSAFKPINVLKGHITLGMKSGIIRSSLVVFQFVISIFLIIATLTIQKQLGYIQNKKLGFEKDQVLVVNEASALGNKIESFKEDLCKNSFILSGTISSYLPVAGTWRSNDTFWGEGTQPTPENMEGFVHVQKWKIDCDYIKTLGITLKTGRGFMPGSPADSTAVILNESAVKQFDFGDNPLGKTISHFNGENQDGSVDPKNIKTWTVIGVVEDFHFESFKQTIAPLGFFLSPSNANVSFRFEATNTQEVIKTIEKSWKELAPGQPFKYSFLNDDFGRMYSSEQRLGKMFAIFGGLAILIACLGLFGLSAFTAEQRTKEIGIRKVLGATVIGIVVLLSKEFGKLILFAFLLTLPLAWYAVHWWLGNYAYKVEIGFMVYVAAGALALIISWLTMGYQSIKAASANPASSLRSE